MSHRAARAAGIVTRAAAAGAVLLCFGAAIVLASNGDEGGAPAERGGAGWGALAPSPFNRSEVGAARIGDRIYVVGGFIASGGTTRKVARYDISSDRWRRVKRLPIAVNHPAVAAHRGKLYVLGGQWPKGGDQNRKSDRLYRYSPRRKRWRRLADAPTARGALALAGIGRKLYAAGGYTRSNQELRKLEVYTPKRNRWRRGPAMPTGRNHVAGVALGGELYVLGGRVEGGANLDIVERYDPGSRTWREAAPLAVPRSGFVAVKARGRIVAFGGEELGEGGGTIAEVERYDPGSDSWSALPEMITPRHGLGGAARHGRVFALEGGPRPGLHFSRAVEYLDVD